jgi:hypothetical protein
MIGDSNLLYLILRRTAVQSLKTRLRLLLSGLATDTLALIQNDLMEKRQK